MFEEERDPDEGYEPQQQSAQRSARSAPAQPRTYDAHPLFPRADGSPEDANIRFVTFLRRTDGALKHCPEDIPAHEVQSWDQVCDWWGGGDYQAIAKNEHHVVIRHYPGKSEWMSFDGPPRPLVKRGAVLAPAAPAPARAPEAAAPPAAAAAPGMTEVLNVLTKLVERLDRPAQGGSDAMLAMMNNQATIQAAQIKADAEVKAAQVKAEAEARALVARAEADARIAQQAAQTKHDELVFGLITHKDGGEDKLAQALSLLQPYLKPNAAPPPPPPPPPPDPFETLERAKSLGLLGAPAAASLASDIKPIAETFGTVITHSINAEAKAKQADAEVRKAEIEAGRAGEARPPRRERDREPPPPLHYVEDLGMVHVVHPVAPRRPPAAVPLPAVSAPPAAPVMASAPAAVGAPAVASAPPGQPEPPPESAAPPRGPLPVSAAVPPPAPSPETSARARASHLRLVDAPTEPSPDASTPLRVPSLAPLPVAPAAEPAPAERAPAEAPAEPTVAEAEPAEHRLSIEDLPPEIASVASQAIAEVTMDDKAQVAGMLGKLKQLSVESRIPVIQRFFPGLDDREARQWGEMIDALPMLQVWSLVDTIKPAEIHRIKHLNGFNPPAG